MSFAEGDSSFRLVVGPAPRSRPDCRGEIAPSADAVAA